MKAPAGMLNLGDGHKQSQSKAKTLRNHIRTNPTHMPGLKQDIGPGCVEQLESGVWPHNVNQHA
jgi:hypothetical protein